MALRAVFIGVNQHRDPGISELTGAANDATAMWALFKDSLHDIADQRLLDHEATASAIRDALDATLGAAAEDDTVIVYFAGHGTPGHQLVPFDADLGAVDRTTIPMQELVDRTRATAARASLVILDCCFSGGGPARVVESLPTPRATKIRVTDLGGNGRVVIAAAGDDQAALERGQHGLFTAALLDVVQDGPDWTDVGVLMNEVTQRVRADAGRTGHVQRPAWAGHIEGGLELPPLKPGPNFVAAFPETLGVRVGTALDELSVFGLPAPVLDAWSERFTDLNALQLTAINDFRVLDGRSLLVVAPTTSGKTFVGELAAARAIAEGRKAVFLLPYKALANEKYEDFEALYGQRLGLRILRCTGDYADQTEPFVKGQYDVALLTYEMFLGLSVAVPAALAKIGLVVLDEAQFISDPSRGIGVELMLTNLIAGRERGIEPQIVALSAVIGNVNHLDEWLGCQTLETAERPVPLVEGVLDRSGTYQYVDVDGKERSEQLLAFGEIMQRRDKPSSQDVIVPLVRKLVASGEQVIVFRNKKGPSKGCANYLSAELGLPPAAAALATLPEQDPSTVSDSLRRAMRGGAAFHNGDLSREERVVVERAFRQRKGPIRTLVATSTVAAGVNTPAETVIIVETEFPGRTPQLYTVATYKNMAGRAGRLGQATRGRSILLAPDGIQRAQLFARYVRGQPEPIRSSFDPRELDTWVLRLLAQVKEIRRDRVVTLLANTYAGYLESRRSSTWESEMRARVEDLLAQMTRFGLVEEEMELVRLSLLGMACGRSHLKLRSAMRLVELLRSCAHRKVRAEMLLALTHALPEFDQAYTPMFRRGKREAVWPERIARLYGADVASMLQRGASDNMAYYARCKRVAALHEWTCGTPISEIEKAHTVNPWFAVGAGDVRGFAELARFHLSAAFEIADVLVLAQGPEAEEVERLLAQLEAGIPAGALGLLDLPLQLERGAYLALHEAGLGDPEEVLGSSEAHLAGIVGAATAARLRSAAPSGSEVGAPS